MTSDKTPAATEGALSRAQWMPIKLAPVNVRGLVWVADQSATRSPIMFGGLKEYRMDFGEDRHRYAWAEGLNGDWNITHWMPLPPAPPSSEAAVHQTGDGE